MKSALANLQRLESFLAEEWRITGLALLRICLGTVALINSVSHIREFNFLWGNAGMVPFDAFLRMMHERRSFSLYALTPNEGWHLVVFYAGIAISTLFILGWRTRIVSPLFAVFTWSLFERNLFILDGGDNLLYLLSFLLIFTDCGRALSMDADRYARSSWKPGKIRSLLHNVALAGILTQITILYATSALSKLTGHMWQDGTAIYYILRTDEFNLSPLAHFFWQSDVVVVFMTYSTMAFQVLWPFLIWSRRFKLAMALGALLLHGSIGYFMGLTWFSMVMVGAEFTIFSDREYSQLANSAANLLGRARAQLGRVGAFTKRIAPRPESSQAPVEANRA